MTSMSDFPAAKPRLAKIARPESDDAIGDPENGQSQIRGLGPMTRVTTAFGQVHAHVLRERDRVRTKNGEFLAITRIDRMVLDADFLHYHPDAQPILIRAGAFGRGIPAADVLLAPHQRLDARQTFVANSADTAMGALHKPHVCRKTESMITYTTFHCGEPATVNCEGLWVEIAP